MRRAKYAIVIKTDSYAGNFEREMCAYVTGHTGDCEVGEEFVDEDIAKKFVNIIGNEQDDNGCYRPVALGCDIDGYTNQDVVIFFDDKPGDEHIGIIKERLDTFDYESAIKVEGIEMVEFYQSIKSVKL